MWAIPSRFQWTMWCPKKPGPAHADMRGVFTRRNRVIPLIGRDGRTYAVEPKTHRLRQATIAEFGRHGPYKEAPLASAAE